MDSTDWVMYAVLALLIALSAFFSASETAFATANTIRLKNYAEDGNPKAKKALKITDNFDNALSTILIGNNIVNIASASIGTMLATKLFGETSGPLVSTIAMTILVLTFGEIMPKSFAKENSEKLALSFSGILLFLMGIFKPLVILFVKLKEGMNRLYSSGEKTPSVTEQELKYIIETIEEEGVIDEQESDLVQSALDFNDITVAQILTPRVDIVAVNVDDDIDSITLKIFSERFSRIPVYEKSIDRIIGILNTRIFLEYLVRNIKIDLRAIITKCLYVHRSMKISTLLNEFKRHKMHMAVVTDDYGGTMGIVTMEDILEELVGDIWDEYDEIVHGITELGANAYEVSGDLNIYEMFEYIGVSAKNFESSYNTMSGWALEEFEHIPQVGESFDYKNLHITVTSIEDNRITKLKVEVAEQTNDNTDSEEEGY